MQSVDLLQVLANSGPVGLVIIMSVIGWVEWKPSVDRRSADTDRWRQLYETERAAHETTRTALVDQANAATAAISAAQTTEKLLSELKQQQRPGAPA